MPKALFFIEAVRILFFIEHAFNYCKVHRHLRWLCHCRYRPTIDADDNDVAYAMSATFLFDMAMIVLFPIMGRALGMTDQLGIWAGTAVSGTKTASKFLMVCALAAIGLNTSFASMKKAGIRPMIHGFIISALVVIVALLSGDGHGNRVRKLQDN